MAPQTLQQLLEDNKIDLKQEFINPNDVNRLSEIGKFFLRKNRATVISLVTKCLGTKIPETNFKTLISYLSSEELQKMIMTIFQQVVPKPPQELLEQVEWITGRLWEIDNKFLMLNNECVLIKAVENVRCPLAFIYDLEKLALKYEDCSIQTSRLASAFATSHPDTAFLAAFMRAEKATNKEEKIDAVKLIHWFAPFPKLAYPLANNPFDPRPQLSIHLLNRKAPNGKTAKEILDESKIFTVAEKGVIGSWFVGP